MDAYESISSHQAKKAAETESATQEHKASVEKVEKEIKADNEKEKAAKAAAEAEKEKTKNPRSMTANEWTANMPEHHLQGYAQQKAESKSEESSDSESDAESSDSDSDSDSE